MHIRTERLPRLLLRHARLLRALPLPFGIRYAAGAPASLRRLKAFIREAALQKPA